MQHYSLVLMRSKAFYILRHGADPPSRVNIVPSLVSNCQNMTRPRSSDADTDMHTVGFYLLGLDYVYTMRLL